MAEESRSGPPDTATQAEADRKATFPRGLAFPDQSPLYWVDQKDRYLRQLLIRDIEEATGRSLIVYYTDCQTNAQIDHYDDQYLLELVGDVKNGECDLLIETNGGITDATEKVVSILRAQLSYLRVVVPKRAKSNGTLLALAADEIVMGPASELGPIDPNLQLQPGTFVPAQFIVRSPQPVDPIIHQAADHAIKQTQKLAKTLLRNGMLKNKADPDIDRLVEQLSTRDVYYSHGSVIDAEEAKSMGLNIAKLPNSDPLWKWFWLLRCMYEADARKTKVIKIFEGRRISNSIEAI
jgi:hypothetical protein